jgi:hypothetical protein
MLFFGREWIRHKPSRLIDLLPLWATPPMILRKLQGPGQPEHVVIWGVAMFLGLGLSASMLWAALNNSAPVLSSAVISP